jgi:DMSO/TMAO reductase YedYZ molybdopterin-dependent catalytic subunit
VVAEPFRLEELELAKRNRGLPLEALTYPITPAGLHFVLVHYDVPALDASSWRLTIDGLVERPRELSLADLETMPAAEATVTLECAGNGRARLEPRPFSMPWLEDGVGTARWKGASLRALLDETGVLDEAVELVFSGHDRGFEGDVEGQYGRSLTIREALDGNALLAYEMNGAPLPPQHGFPVRLVVPGWYGMASVKWLTSIEAVGEPFRGHHQAVAYRIQREPDEDGVPVPRMLPRALMIPPGIPSFPERRRSVDLGEIVLEGRAWSGHGPVEAVAVSTDGGRTWDEAALDRDVDSPWAWCRWQLVWTPAAAGEVELVCRARDAAGNVQPLEPAWNVGGYANNAVQRLTVTVRS